MAQIHYFEIIKNAFYSFRNKDIWRTKAHIDDRIDKDARIDLHAIPATVLTRNLNEKEVNKTNKNN